MSFTEIRIPAEIFPPEKIESVLARWEKKRRGLLGPLLFPDSCKRRLTRIEKVYIPHYLFIFHQSTRAGVEVHYVLIDAVCGFGVFTNADLKMRNEEATEPIFPALVSQEKGLEKAKDWLTRWNIRKHAFHLKPPELLSSQVRFFHFPFWVAYYQRPKGRVDIEVIEGVQGYLEGGRTKYLIQRGYAALQESGTTRGQPESELFGRL
jgi:hypothetical protein